jgi:hypothetical protein
VIETEGRHLTPAELASGQQPAVAGDELIVAIDQDWDIEAEGLDAAGDLPDLLLAVQPRVGGVRFELAYQAIDNCQLSGQQFTRTRTP